MEAPSPAVRWTVEDVLGPGGIAEEAWPGYEARPAQIRMTQAILDRLLEGGPIAVEAPTGVGKTLAYLLAAVLSGRRVLVSTHTKTLQDQIVDSDLPKLRALLARMGLALQRARPDDGPPEPHEIRFALMKGRANYLCLAKLDRKSQQGSFGFGDAADPLVQIRSWSEQSERGDRVELGQLSEADGIWSELDARSETCTGSRCPRYDACFVMRMRKEAQAARLIVVNHHLLLSDLALKAEASLSDRGSFGEVVPDADGLILDEAHGLEQVASEYFGGQVSLRKLERLSNDVATFLAETPAASSACSLHLTRAQVETENLFRNLPPVDGRVRIAATGGSGAENTQWEPARSRLGDTEAALRALAADLEALADADPVSEQLARRALELWEGIRFVLAAEDPDFVYWSERQGKSASLGASPILASNLLRHHLFPRFGAVAMCSATLSAGRKDLSYFLESLGAPEDTETLVLGSPFDFERQAALYLPANVGAPDGPAGVERALPVLQSLVELVGGGALLLFTSNRAMREAYRRLKPKLAHPASMQGEAPKRELIQDFVARAPAVLFATASFWEGVDIPGDPLRLVVIDRLPFDPPTDPLLAARAERIERRGGSAFRQLQLPRAILRLKQGFGRLVRSRHDRGVVAILDGRIRTRGYGRRFVDALPPVPCFHDLDGLRDWWDGPGP
jgi:ATP-dependent DNA helicase DinG